MATPQPLIVIVCIAALSSSAWSADNAASAAQAPVQPSQNANPASTATSASTADAEVKKIDKENLKITLKHGEIRNLNMPSMTMVFKVKNPALLDQVQLGDKVRFAAEQIDGAIVVTHIEAAR